jgi:TRAP-type C4-dicarboxylate transport system permease large subunit
MRPSRDRFHRDGSYHAARGLNLYAAGAIEPDLTLEDIISGMIPFLMAEAASPLLIFFVPVLTTFLLECAA